MVSEDLCPATGRICRDPICERGGCRKARAKSSAVSAVKPSASVGRIERRKADSTAEELRRAAEDAANAKLRAELEAVLGDAIEALEHSDATLTFLQQSLGVRTSPRLDQLRQAKLN